MIQELMTTLKRSWFSHFWINFATSCVLALSFGFIFGAALLSKNISRVMSVWGDEIQVTVYLKDEITPLQNGDLVQKIKNHQSILKFDYIDKQRAAQTFEKSLQNYGPHFLNTLKAEVGNPFPASYQIQLKPEFKSPEAIEEISLWLKSTSGVEDVSYGQEWVSNYTTLMRFGRILGVVFGLIILVSCLFTVSNSIQASLNSRREEIEILELIGATARMIRKPFLLEGAFQGFLASALALFLLGLIYYYSVGILEKTLGGGGISSHLQFFSFAAILFMSLLGAAIGAMGSYLCVTRINTGWAAVQGKKS